MALDTKNCKVYQKGEIAPLIFKIYTDSGLPFTLVKDTSTGVQGYEAYCDLMDEEGNHISFLPATPISDEPTEKAFLCSWDTSSYSQSYYRLQVWACVNISGSTDSTGLEIIEGRLCSEEITRYVRE